MAGYYTPLGPAAYQKERDGRADGHSERLPKSPRNDPREQREPAPNHNILRYDNRNERGRVTLPQ